MCMFKNNSTSFQVSYNKYTNKMVSRCIFNPIFLIKKKCHTAHHYAESYGLYCALLSKHLKCICTKNKQLKTACIHSRAANLQRTKTRKYAILKISFKHPCSTAVQR